MNGVLKFYEGDTFTYCLTLELTDQDGVPFTLDPDCAVLKFRFYNCKNVLVKEFVFGGENGGDIIDNKVELNFDSTATALFRRGKYHYDCILECGERRVTLADNALLTVD